jgi:hypothetical protein
MVEEKFKMEDNEEMELVKYLLNQTDNFIEAVICGSMEASRRCATMFEIDEQGRMSDASPLEMLRNIKDGERYIVVEVQPEENMSSGDITLLIEDPENYNHRLVVSNNGRDIEIIKLRDEDDNIVEEVIITTSQKEHTVSVSVNSEIVENVENREALMGLLSSIKSYLTYKEGYKWVVDFRHALAPDTQKLLENTEELIARLKGEYQDDISRGSSNGNNNNNGKGMLS